jgi:hypothetical protein
MFCHGMGWKTLHPLFSTAPYRLPKPRLRLIYPEDFMMATLPDYSMCKTHHITSQLWKCLVKDPADCPFSVELRIEFFCLHPNCEVFGRDSG